MELTDGSGFDGDLSGSDGLRNREGARVNNLDSSTVELGGLSLGEEEGEWLVDLTLGADGCVLVGLGHG